MATGIVFRSLQNTSAAATGSVGARGSVARSLSGAIPGISGLHTVLGSLSRSLASTAGLGWVYHSLLGASNRTMAATASAGAGSSIPFAGQSARTLSDATLAASGQHMAGGASARQLAGASLVASGSHSRLASLGKTLGSTSGVGQGLHAVTGSLSYVLVGSHSNASGYFARNLGTVHKTLGNVTSSASGNTGFVVAFRFGNEGRARIRTTASLTMENNAFPPGVSVYQPIIPFTPANIVTGAEAAAAALAASSTSSDPPMWEATAARLDITFFQQDDVLLPIQIQDPALQEFDSSFANQANWVWSMQIRRTINRRAGWYGWGSGLIGTFTAAEAVYTAPAPPTQPLGFVTAKFELPSALNRNWGVFRYDIRSASPYGDYGSDAPAGWPAGYAWPPVNRHRTWVYGYAYIVPRTTENLPFDVPTLALGAHQWPVTVEGVGFAVGESGRISA